MRAPASPSSLMIVCSPRGGRCVESMTTVAAAAFIGPSHLAAFGGLGGGSPWILFARQMWGLGWVILFLAVVNSFFANGNSALIASTRTWYAMGRIRLLPSQFSYTSPRHASPVVGIAVQSLMTVVIALPLALGYGPETAFELLATILSAVMIGIYIVINLSSIGYYWRRQRSEFNWLLHLVLPGIGALILVPVLAAAAGVGSSTLRFVTPLPYPVSVSVSICWPSKSLMTRAAQSGSGTPSERPLSPHAAPVLALGSGRSATAGW